MSSPADHATVAEWAGRVALSERSLSRMLMDEIGMSFGHWRRQLHVILALRRLSAGETVQTVAVDLGYESASSFVTMFRKMVGKPPIRYLVERQTSVPLRSSDPPKPRLSRHTRMAVSRARPSR
ncbi:helix-turn-helix domain-containing protein [Rhodopseudomonas palustris]|uniref:helix-turn-helix domain-containing protein n=1 Tax=Rhodopseudomonas palustris TaxID=1076 RepID=UPI0021F2A477|nr:helix-turn-helix domain-containing protein [Rhodopseudomonas palustris]